MASIEAHTLKKRERREEQRTSLFEKAGVAYDRHVKLPRLIAAIPEKTADKVSTIVKEEVQKVNTHIDNTLEQYFGKPPRENETYAETKQRYKTERAHQDEALKNLEAQRRIEKAAEVKKQKAEEREKQQVEAKKQRAEDRKIKRAEDKAAAAVNNEEAANEEAEDDAVNKVEIAKAKKKAAEDKKAAAKATAKAKSVTPMLVEH